MLKIFNHVKLRARVAAVAVFPILGLLALGIANLDEQRQEGAEMAKLHRLANLAPTISALVHELQKERGNSAGFLGAKGEGGFRTKLTAQRQATEPARKTLLTAFEQFDADAYSVALRHKIDKAQVNLAGLDGIRRKVDGLTIDLPAMAGFYTGAITDLLSIIGEMVPLSSNAEVTNSVSTYLALLEAKERAGLERAMGANGFGAGEFKPAVHRRFIDLIAQQRAFMASFITHATPNQRTLLERTVTGPAVDEVTRLEQIAIDSRYGGGTQGIKGPVWFDAITKKIDMMKAAEDGIAADLQARAEYLKGEADRGMFVIAGAIAGLLVVTTALVTIITRGITRPITRLGHSMNRLADGDKTVAIDGTECRNEIGDMARSVQVFKDNALRLDEMNEEQRRIEERAREERRKSIIDMAKRVNAETRAVVNEVENEVSEAINMAEGVAGSVKSMADDAADSTDAADQTLEAAQSVAAATEELVASIDEISRQVVMASEMAARAVHETETADSDIRSLTDAAEMIGSVIELISEIAEKTNLLALNATIEAARAGDAGKGFAVVANEVKSLANQTANATGQIAEQVKGIQAVVHKAAGAISQIGETIQSVNEVSATVASAVEEQRSATQEISRSVGETASLAKGVSERMKHTRKEALKNEKRGLDIRHSATALAEVVQALRGTLVRVLRTATEDLDRRSERRFSVYLEATAVHNGKTLPVLVRNISVHGMMLIDCDAEVKAGQAIKVEVPDAGWSLAGVAVAGDLGTIHLRVENSRVSDQQLAAISERTLGKLIGLAKQDHLDWMKRVMDTVGGAGDTHWADVASHRTCRLGRWYDSVTEKELRNLPAFARLANPHKCVHVNGREALRRYAEGDTRGAAEAATRMQAASKEVLELLDQLGGELRDDYRQAA